MCSLCIILHINDDSDRKTNKNIALKKPAKQSTIGWGGIANRAVDGNTNGRYQSGSIQHTNNKNGWWEVDLGKEYDISKVVIYNRTDCCQTRINNSIIKLLKSNRSLYKSANYGIQKPIKTFNF